MVHEPDLDLALLIHPSEALSSLAVRCLSVLRAHGVSASAAATQHRPSHIAVVVVPRASEHLAWLAAAPRAQAVIGIVQVHRELPKALRLARVDYLVDAPDLETHLPLVLEQVTRSGSRIPFLLQRASQLRTPPLLTAAVRHCLMAAVDPQAPPRSLTAVCRRMGCSTRHLRMLAADAGIDLRQLVRLGATLHALRSHARGASWERVAFRMGYAGPSSISNLIFSSTGLRSRDVPEGRLMNAVELQILSILDRLVRDQGEVAERCG